MSVNRAVKSSLFKMKVSRFMRGTTNQIKRKFSSSDAGSPDNIFGEDIRPIEEIDREKKAKSTAVVLVAGTAIGLSQVSSIASKHGLKLTSKQTMAAGIVIGATIAGVWYNCVDAAGDDISSDDIDMMLDIVQSTSVGKTLHESDNGTKAFDILHAIITGGDVEEETKVTRKMSFDREDDDDEEDEKSDNKDDPFKQVKKNFSDIDDDDDDDDDEPSKSKRSSIFTLREPVGIGKATLADSSYPKSRSSFIPGSGGSRAERSQKSDSWLEH